MSPHASSEKSLGGSRDSLSGEDRWRAAILWLALGLAFSPVLADLARHELTQPWSRYSLVFPLLFALCVHEERWERAPRRDGFFWLGLGVLVEIVAVGGGVIRFGRIGFILATIGLCRSFALASPRSTLLILWFVPIPHSVSAVASPEIEETLLGLAVRIVALFGGNVIAKGTSALGPSGQLSLSHAEGGPLLMALLSGVGWYAAVRDGRDLAGCLRRAASWGVAALAVQASAVLLATAALALGAPARLSRVLTNGLWALAAGIGVLWVESRTRGAPRDS